MQGHTSRRSSRTPPPDDHRRRNRLTAASGIHHHTLLLLPATPYVSGFFVCHVCWERGSGPHYHCPECQLDIHVACAASGSSHETHFSHFAHPLHASASASAAAAAAIDALCDGCGDVRAAAAAAAAADAQPPGSGHMQQRAMEAAAENYYRCVRCDFDLCPLCTRAPRFLLHPSHPLHVLALCPPDESVSTSCRCDGCGGGAMGMMYRCTACNFDLHEACVRLPLKPLHRADHPLTLLFDKSNTIDHHVMHTSCDACGQEMMNGEGPTAGSWVYTCIICHVFLHPKCARIQHHVPPLHSPMSTRHAAIKPASVVNRAMTSLDSRISNLWHPSSNRHQLIHSQSLQKVIKPYDSYHEDNVYDRSHVGNGATSPRLPYNNVMSNSTNNCYLDHSNNTIRHGHDCVPTNFSSYSSNNIALAQALSAKLAPIVSARDREAMDRVLAILRRNASHSCDQCLS